MKNVWTRAFELLTLRLLLRQLGLAIAAALLFLIWLRVPDANVIDVAFSILLGLLILAVTMSGEAAILLKLRSHPLTRRRVVRDALMLAIAILLWFAWSELIDRLSMHDVLRAGYLNSRFPHAYRNFFSYPHFCSGSVGCGRRFAGWESGCSWHWLSPPFRVPIRFAQDCGLSSLQVTGWC